MKIIKVKYEMSGGGCETVWGQLADQRYFALMLGEQKIAILNKDFSIAYKKNTVNEDIIAVEWIDVDFYKQLQKLLNDKVWYFNFNKYIQHLEKE